MSALVFAVVLATLPHARDPEYRRQSCSIDGVVDQIRGGLKTGSPSYQRYLRTLLGRTAAALPDARLRELFDRERDPAMLEALAQAMVLRTDRVDDPASLQAVAARALSDADPAARAAVVRALRRSSALENTNALYEQLVRDPSAEVRREAAQNLVEDNNFVYAGQVAHAADTAVTAAAASPDPKVTAQILGNISTESVSASSASELRWLAGNESSDVRAAAAKALGGVPASESVAAHDTLTAQLRSETDPAVKKAIVAALARLGFSDAIPQLEQIGRADPSLRTETDQWISALATSLQEWSLVLREKQKLEAR